MKTYNEMNNANVILADCRPEEVKDFADGCCNAANVSFEVESSISNWGHGALMQNLRRYASYFLFPLKIFTSRKKYGTILGWQQFYAINFAFFAGCSMCGNAISWWRSTSRTGVRGRGWSVNYITVI